MNEYAFLYSPFGLLFLFDGDPKLAEEPFVKGLSAVHLIHGWLHCIMYKNG
jgi:hypothetical protein